MELRTSGERAVLVGGDGCQEREVDPRALALPGELSAALHEWARVAAAVHRSGAAGEREAANSVVSRRGRQLAGRLAAEMGTPVNYRDPMTGDVSVVDAAPPAPPSAEPRREPARVAPPEPTPWATGLTVTAFVAIVMATMVLTFVATLDETSPWLAFGADIVVTAGLAPSMWLARKVRIWRWVAYGAAAGLAVGWLGLPFILFATPGAAG